MAKKTRREVRQAVHKRGYIYHGRIKGLAEAAREAGLEF
jgi:ribosomal protein L18